MRLALKEITKLLAFALLIASPAQTVTLDNALHGIRMGEQNIAMTELV